MMRDTAISMGASCVLILVDHHADGVSEPVLSPGVLRGAGEKDQGFTAVVMPMRI
jgi:hypothetical protein